jgi:hypothetical protein
MASVNTNNDPAEFNRQLEEARSIRKFAYSIIEGKHDGNFERKDYIGFAQFNRCLQLHESTELVARASLIDDAWVLVRSLVEHAVNCVYMFYVSDAATADNFNDYQYYMVYKNILDLKGTDEVIVRQLVSAEDEAKMRLRFEAVRDRFDDKRGDKWCADDALYKRAIRLDGVNSDRAGEKLTDFTWLVNTVWRYASGYTHGTAGALSDQLGEDAGGVIVRRSYTFGEAAKAVQSANSGIYLALLPVDVRLGGKNATELNRRFVKWVSGKYGSVSW